MASPLTNFERRTIYLSLFVYAISFLLPAYRIQLGNDADRHFNTGYEMAWFVEAVFWNTSWEAVNRPFRASSASFAFNESDWKVTFLVLFPGAMANHCFLLGCLTLYFRWLRMAVLCSFLSAVFAIGCLLPWQIIDRDTGWSLGPGYFVWCAATVILAVAAWRIARRELKSQPLLDGIFTSRK